MARTVLVIGATGILAPAASELAARGDSVISVSSGRRPVRTDVPSTVVDARDAAALGTALEGVSWDDAIVYAPAVGDDSLELLIAATAGRCVLVRTSQAADPARGESPVPADTLQLGWTAGTPARWHTPGEVSAAALAVLSDGEPRTLGVVRPWSGRP